MPSVAAGAVDSAYIPLACTLTITPGTNGLVRFGCNDPQQRDQPAPQTVTIATDVDVPAGSTIYVAAEGSAGSWAVKNGGSLQLADGSVFALSEAFSEVLANPSATTTVLTGAGEYVGYRCTVAAGNITVYDNTAASGKVLVPTTALQVGAFPIYGAGTNHRLTVTTGITVVLSGAATVYIGKNP